MIGRLIKFALVVLVLVLVIQRLFNRKQKKEVHFWFVSIAVGLILASLLALLAAWLRTRYP
ncbi:hypothetical protein [Snodgrassella sp. CFCC 13594]|uniref:protein MIGRI n=1 Tax=Snodgrassella sp. CFCC 13594 TaxID=1775559 RepID=UPI00082BCC86|nr:hypothetical protein [Snodgrassella sp. CFCC 13594]